MSIGAAAAMIAVALAVIAVVAGLWRLLQKVSADAIARAERDQLEEGSDARERQNKAIADSRSGLWARVLDILRQPPP